MSENRSLIQTGTTVKATLKDVWDMFTSPHHITQWNFASDDWHCPHAENDLHVGGKFMYRMEDKAGNNGFDFRGVYSRVEPQQLIEYLIEDGRKVHVNFASSSEGVEVIQRFEAEEIHSVEMQRSGWQAILNNFKSYVEKA